jgi:hypothetical protein
MKVSRSAAFIPWSPQLGLEGFVGLKPHTVQMITIGGANIKAVSDEIETSILASFAFPRGQAFQR